MALSRRWRAERRRFARAGALASAALLVACATAALKKYHRAQLARDLKFSHKRHTGEADCGDCHEGVQKSAGATRGAFIKKKEHGGCGGCHEEEVAAKSKCGFCHFPGRDKRIELSRVDRHLRFSHASHGKKRVGKGCKRCHPAAYTATKPGAKMVQAMSGCVASCHERDLAALRCAKCHRDLTRYPVAAVGKLTHRGDFIRRHGVLARDARRCASCHDQTYCASCHARTAAMRASIRFPERVGRRFIHRGDWLGRHSTAARARASTCRKCHGSRHCSACHELRGLMPPAQPQSAGTATRKVHGPDFMIPGSAGFHGRLARRGISRCASCHDRGAASNCVQCHKVGALGGNPHPANFRWRDKSGACRSDRMCLVCHAGGAGCR